MSKLKEEELLDYIKAEESQALLASKTGEDEGGWWLKRARAFQQIKEMIQKPEVTEEWIEEKAKAHVYDLLDLRPVMVGMGNNTWVKKTKDFIRSLVEEIQGKK